MTQHKALPFNSKLLLAPLAGYTDYPFRKLCSQHGAGMVYTELISAEGLIRNSKKTYKLMEIFKDEAPVGIQLFGNKPENIAQAAQMAAKLDPALIDINMGCCAQKVCSSGSGAALLKDLDLLYEAASQTVAAVDIPVTAKIRLGWDEKSRNYMKTLEVLQKSAVAAVTVHGRTRMQHYTGHADWNAIIELAQAADIPVIGNGDIESYKCAKEKLETSGCYAVMIGRSALGNPWIFSGKEPTLHERVETAKSHIRDMVEYYGDYGVILARKHSTRYFHAIRGASAIRANLVRADSLNETLDIMDSIL